MDLQVEAVCALFCSAAVLKAAINCVMLPRGSGNNICVGGALVPSSLTIKRQTLCSITEAWFQVCLCCPLPSPMVIVTIAWSQICFVLSSVFSISKLPSYESTQPGSSVMWESGGTCPEISLCRTTSSGAF